MKENESALSYILNTAQCLKHRLPQVRVKINGYGYKLLGVFSVNKWKVILHKCFFVIVYT